MSTMERRLMSRTGFLLLCPSLDAVKTGEDYSPETLG
jgi:hypothetical protein